MQEVLNNPLVSSCKADISRAEARLQELTTRLGDNHPQVVEAKANMAELRSQLEAETRRVTGGVGVSNTINRQRDGRGPRALEAQRAKVLQMKAVRDEGLVLLRDVENAQRSLRRGVHALQPDQPGRPDHAEQRQPAHAGQPPLEPSSPKMLLNTLLSIFLGTLLAVGAALLLELTRPPRAHRRTTSSQPWACRCWA